MKFMRYLAGNLFYIGLMIIGNFLEMQEIASKILVTINIIAIVILVISILIMGLNEESELKKKFLKRNVLKFRLYYLIEPLIPIIAYKLQYKTLAFTMFIELMCLIILMTAIAAEDAKKRCK